MALHFDLKVNGKPIGSFYARRLNPGIPTPDSINSYEYLVEANDTVYDGTIQHRFGDGGWILVKKVIEQIEGEHVLESTDKSERGE